jgi:outer membrane autotransporter protein
MAQSITAIGDVNPAPVSTPTWDVPGGEIYVGDTGGVGTLTIQGGATASSATGALGYTGGDGTVTVTGSDASGSVSSWTMPGDLAVGAGGTASLSILNGGLVSNAFGNIASGGGTASATVSGVDVHGNRSTWINAVTLTVGNAGAGSLLIENGGLVRSVQGAIGGTTGVGPGVSSGTVTVRGSDGNGRVSTWELGNNLYVGFLDPGDLFVEDGGAITGHTAYIGYQVGGNGTATVSGQDAVSGRASSFDFSAQLNVGYEGTGELTIEDSGTVRTSLARIAVQAGSTGTLHLNGNALARGVLETDVVIRGDGAATLDLNGGILRVTWDESDFLRGFTTLAGGAEGVWLDTNNHAVGIGTAFTGAASFNKLGLGALTMSGLSTYAGATTITAGTLRAGVANAFSAASAHTVAAGATLDTAGLDQTVASLDNAGTVALLGAAPGSRLTVSGAYVGHNALLRIGTALGDSSSVSDRLVLDGAGASASGTTTVQVTNLGGLGALTTGDGIEVISAINGATTTAQTTRDAFRLAGDHVDAGAYEYRLYAADANGAGENWFLRSSALAADAATPAYRVEVPLFAALPEQLRLGNAVMLGNWHQRIGDGIARGAERQTWARIISAERTISQRGDASPRSQGRLNGLQAGTDLWAKPNWRAGLYVGQLDGDMKVRGFASGTVDQAVGGNDLRSQYLGVYATYQHPNGLYVDAVLQGGRHRYHVSPQTASASHGKGDSLLASMEVGRGFTLAQGWVLEPQLQLMHQRIDLDGVRIAGADVHQDSHGGWAVRAGLRVKGETTTAAGVLQPYGRVNLYSGSKGWDVTRFTGPAGFADVATGTGGVSTELAAGATLALSARTGLYGEIGTVWASSGQARHRGGLNGSVGIRVQW